VVDIKVAVAYSVIVMTNHYRELRIACTVAQLEREGGVSPRISPLAQVQHFVTLPAKKCLKNPW
jgi:hypothetical protein